MMHFGKILFSLSVNNTAWKTQVIIKNQTNFIYLFVKYKVDFQTNI